MRLLLATVMTLVAASAADASDLVKSPLDLAVRIPRVMRLTLLDHPRSVDVSPEDIARGFVRVRGLRVDILCNDRGGYVVRAELTGSAFDSAEVAGLPASIRVATHAASAVAMPSMVGGPRRSPAAVDYVLRLARSTAPGPQPWPVALAIEAP